MFGRIRDAAVFQRLLATAPRKRSAHFVIHFLNERSQAADRASKRVGTKELSTKSGADRKQPVDDFSAPSPASTASAIEQVQPRHWLGYVVPKRHARRAVTRNLMRRQMRAVVARHESRLEPGLWLIRLRGPFAAAQYPSAASPALRAAVRAELESLLTQCERPQPGAAALTQEP